MRHVGSSSPDQRLNPRPLYWKRGVLTTGPLGKSPERSLLSPFILQCFPCSELGWKCRVWSECVLRLVRAVRSSMFTPSTGTWCPNQSDDRVKTWCISRWCLCLGPTQAVFSWPAGLCPCVCHSNLSPWAKLWHHRRCAQTALDQPLVNFGASCERLENNTFTWTLPSVPVRMRLAAAAFIAAWSPVPSLSVYAHSPSQLLWVQNWPNEGLKVSTSDL